MKAVTVSVVMPVYNAQRYLSQAVESILKQSYTNLEFIIINDGSTDKSGPILDAYAKKDSRIKLLSQTNEGLVASLNRGIKEAAGKYIARQDADDRSEPYRFQKQVAFLESNPELVILGSSIKVMDESSKVMHQHALLLKDPELREELLVRSPFAHGSAMFKREEAIKAGLYDSRSWPAEDYDFWVRLSRFGELANLDDYLYIYREHGLGISQTNTRRQQIKLKLIQDKAWQQRERLLKGKVNLRFYENLDMGQLRIERIINNSALISKIAWRHGERALALKSMSRLAARGQTYRKAAGKIKRRVKR